jgi:hypothetical protein
MRHSRTKSIETFRPCSDFAAEQRRPTKDELMIRRLWMPMFLVAITMLSAEPALSQNSIGGRSAKQNSLGGPTPPKSLVLPPRVGGISPTAPAQVKVGSGDGGAARKRH